MPRSIDIALSNMDTELAKLNFPNDLKGSLEACGTFWFRTLGSDDDPRVRSLKGKKIRQTIRGRLVLGHAEKPFCFISAECGDSYFCMKSDLPEEITDGATLAFDAVPSFYKKKNKESWKAVNIRSVGKRDHV